MRTPTGSGLSNACRNGLALATLLIGGSLVMAQTLGDLSVRKLLVDSDGTAGGAAPVIQSGTLTPEGAVTGNVGDLFLRTDGGTGTVLYIKESGTGNTGWATAAAGWTTSADVAAGISDETGTGALVFGTSPTLGTPTISGAISFPDGVRQTFNPDATTPGLSVGSLAGDPSTPSNGDLWYNSTTEELTARINGSDVDLGAGGGGGFSSNAATTRFVEKSADESVTSSTALQSDDELTIAVAANTDYTFQFVVYYNGAVAGDLKFALNAPSGSTGKWGCDCLWDTWNNDYVPIAQTAYTDTETRNGPAKATTEDAAGMTVVKIFGYLNVGGSAGNLTLRWAQVTSNGTATTVRDGSYLAITTVSGTTAFTEWVSAGRCDNVTASSPEWSFPTSNPAVPTCDTGTNIQRAYLAYADGASTLGAQWSMRLPADWAGAIDVRLPWYTSATSGDVVWQVQSICVADGETGDPAYNTASTVTDTAKGTTLQHNDAEITTLTITGCAASEQLYLRVFRNPAHGSDTLAATARLIGMEVVYRRSL